jgi:hypothetical protein
MEVSCSYQVLPTDRAQQGRQRHVLVPLGTRTEAATNDRQRTCRRRPASASSLSEEEESNPLPASCPRLLTARDNICFTPYSYLTCAVINQTHHMRTTEIVTWVGRIASRPSPRVINQTHTISSRYSCWWLPGTLSTEGQDTAFCPPASLFPRPNWPSSS